MFKEFLIGIRNLLILFFIIFVWLLRLVIIVGSFIFLVLISINGKVLGIIVGIIIILIDLYSLFIIFLLNFINFILLFDNVFKVLCRGFLLYNLNLIGSFFEILLVVLI